MINLPIKIFMFDHFECFKVQKYTIKETKNVPGRRYITSDLKKKSPKDSDHETFSIYVENLK